MGKPIVFFVRNEPLGLDLMQEARSSRRAFLGYPPLKPQNEVRASGFSERMFDISKLNDGGWEKAKKELAKTHSREAIKQIQQNKNLVRDAIPGSIVIVPRKREGIVYMGTVKSFEVLDKPLSSPWGKAFTTRHAGKNIGDHSLPAEEYAAEFGQSFEIEEPEWIEIHWSDLPNYMQRSMARAARSTGRLKDEKSSLDNAFGAASTLIEQTKSSALINRLISKAIDTQEGRLQAGDSPVNVYLTNYSDWLFPANWDCVSFDDADDRDEYVKSGIPSLFFIVLDDREEIPTFVDKGDQGRIVGVYLASPEKKRTSDCASVTLIDGYKKLGQFDDRFALPANGHCWSVRNGAPHYSELLGKQGLKSLWESQDECLRLDVECLKLLETLSYEREAKISEGKIAKAFGDKPSKSTQKHALPNRAGPPNFGGYLMPERVDGPKETYILEMVASNESQKFPIEIPQNPMNIDGSTFRIFKFGLSVYPAGRAKALNAALPGNQLYWRVLLSNLTQGEAPHRNFNDALRAENLMRDCVERYGISLGGEFFAADESLVLEIWEQRNTEQQVQTNENEG